MKCVQCNKEANYIIKGYSLCSDECGKLLFKYIKRVQKGN